MQSKALGAPPRPFDGARQHLNGAAKSLAVRAPPTASPQRAPLSARAPEKAVPAWHTEAKAQAMLATLARADLESIVLAQLRGGYLQLSDLRPPAR